MYFDTTIVNLLFLGLLPLLYTVISGLRLGIRGIADLRCLGVCFIWLGYHLSPWFAYIHAGRWDSFLFVPIYLREGLIFSILCMLAYLIGYEWQLNSKTRMFWQHFHMDQQFKLPEISTTLLLVVSIGGFILFVLHVGGISEIFEASYTRGAGQFVSRNFLGKILHILTIFNTVYQVMLACMSSIYILQTPKRDFSNIFGITGLLVSSLTYMHGFSRGSGFALLIFSFILLKKKGVNGIFVAIICCLLANYLGAIGLNQRYLQPGLRNYVVGAVNFSTQNTSHTNKLLVPKPESNSLDAMAAWTRKAEAKNREQPRALVMMGRFLWNLNPLPSEFLPVLPMGRDLAQVMGTYGHTGITTPAFADLYYCFSMYGCILVVFLGRIYAWVEEQNYKMGGVVGAVTVLLCFVSFPLGLHSSMRAMTRPVVYSIIIIIIVRYFYNSKIDQDSSR